MSATRMPPPQPAQRVGAAPKKSEAPTPGDDGPSFTHQLHAWLENHRASLVDSLRRLGKQPIGSFFTCLVMAVALSLPMGVSAEPLQYSTSSRACFESPSPALTAM